MKKLNDNFTTLRQSEVLLELGLPEDTADCYYEMSYRPIRAILPDGISFSKLPQYMDDEDGDLDILPCWSAGRLIDIYCKCMGHSGFLVDNEDMIGSLILGISYAKKAGSLRLSKLED